jgi:hypothetical protein
MNPRNIKTKRPWRKIRPEGYLAHGSFGAEAEPDMPHDVLLSDTVTHADMLRQYYPSGHLINDPKYYPDIYREEVVPILDRNGNETGQTSRRLYKECVPRYAFAFQQIISLKQTIHLTGNDIQFELNTSDPTEKMRGIYDRFREGWLGKDMEIHFFDAVKSVKIVADVAFVGFMSDGEFSARTFSYKDGSELYPHFDNRGKLILFARSFYDYDDEGNVVVEWLEVWDDKYLTRMKKTGKGYRSTYEKILERFGASGYTVTERKLHGFPFIPVAYMRDDDGPCWAASQDSIDSYDLSFSQMAHNNQAFGTPILVFQGDGATLDMQHDINGTVRTMSMDKESSAEYLQSQSASESYMRQLDTLYKMIYEQSFAVIPPEMKSGDLPGVALKLLYSPALEKAMHDAAEWQPFLRDMVRIFTYGYGVECESQIDFANLPLKYWIKPYVHINESAMVNDLATAVQNGFCSRQTASERNSEYSSVGEWERIVKEKKQEQQADLLYTIKTKQASTTETDGTNDGKTTEAA